MSGSQGIKEATVNQFLRRIAMVILRLLSWNVNGLRSLYKKGFVQWLEKDSPDILSLQETKVAADQVPVELKSLPG